MDFRPKPPEQAPAFTTDRRLAEQRRRKGLIAREWRLIATMPIALGALIWIIVMLTAPTPPALVVQPLEKPLQPMARPLLAGVAALPTTDEISGQQAEVEALHKRPQDAIAQVGFDLTPLTLAYGLDLIARDRTTPTPPIPQRLDTRDLVLGSIRLGSPVIIGGRLIDSVDPTVTGSQRRLLLELDQGQFAQVLAADDGSPIHLGERIEVVGRYLGQAHLPVEGNKSQAYPLLMVRALAGTAAAIDDPTLAEYRTGMVTMPDRLFDDVKEERPLVETRPYYYLLGLTKSDLGLDNVFAEARSGNLVANDIHQAPIKFRGQPFVVKLKVWITWEDELVARDQPFGVDRVVRILGYHRDFSPFTQGPPDKPVVNMREPLRLFEVAVIGRQPPPAPGSEITVQGRFLKLRAIPVVPDALRDERNGIQRHSDRCYAFMFVAGAWKDSPPPTRVFTANEIAITAAILFAIGLFGWLVWREQRRTSIDPVISKLRESRRKLRNKPAGTESGPTVSQEERPGMATESTEATKNTSN